MIKLDKLRSLHLEHRLKKNSDEISYLSTLISEIERKTKGNKNDLTDEEIQSGVLTEYCNNLIKTGTSDARKELKFLREENIIENRMNIQEIDLNLRDIYSKQVKEDDSFAKNSERYKIVLTIFVKQFVPEVADFDSVKERHQKIFNL